MPWRESLRDIEVTLAANHTKLYAMGLRRRVHRSTLTDANEMRDWRIWSDLAALLIRRARKLYSDTDLSLDLTNTVYALDAMTIDLFLSLFDWAPFRAAKATLKMHQGGAFIVTRAKRNLHARRIYSATKGRSAGVICDQTITTNGFYTAQDYPEHLRRIRFRDPETGKTLTFLTNNTALPVFERACAFLAGYRSGF